MGCVRHLSLELLERYVMEDISSRDRQRVERHVMCCPECLDRLQGEVRWVLAVRTGDRIRRKFKNPPEKPRAKNE
jgi:hypothetical protein